MNNTATTGTFTSNAGKVETTSSCVFWLTGKSGYQEFISERPTADPVKAYIKVKTENIGYGELTSAADFAYPFPSVVMVCTLFVHPLSE